MKSAEELWTALVVHNANGASVISAIEARDSEWRRLVEEAQADLTSARAALLQSDNATAKLVAEIDRLKGELAEARAFVVRVATMGRQVIQPTRLELDAMALTTLRDWWAPPAKHPYPGHCLECSPMQIPQGMAAVPPAEQAYGEGALTLEMLDEVLRDHINDEYDRSTELAKRVEAHDRAIRDIASWCDPTTRARLLAIIDPAPPPPEAAGPATTPIRHPPGGFLLDEKDRFRPDMCPKCLNRRVDRQGRECQYCNRKPEAVGPGCEKLIGSLNAPCTKQRNHGGNCEHDAREAAGPGHAFVRHCGGCWNCSIDGCMKLESDHAVPPIPEGA